MTELKLYAIPGEYRRILEETVIDEETGEILTWREAEDFREAAREKLEATACYVRELETTADVLKEQIAHLQARAKRMTERADSLRALMAQAADALELKSVKTPQISVSFTRKTAPVWTKDKVALDRLFESHPECFRVKTSHELDKTGLNAALKADGFNIPEHLQGLVSIEQKITPTIS